jgi:hypothetical protein
LMQSALRERQTSATFDKLQFFVTVARILKLYEHWYDACLIYKRRSQ